MLNPATSHIHLEMCTPYWGDVTGPITVPFQMQAFHVKGYFYFNAGSLVKDVVFDVPHENHFQGDPMGVVKVTGHFTYDPTIQGGGPNIHSGAPNGWTNFESTAIAVLDNGDTFGTTSLATVWTTLDPNAPLVPDFRPDVESIAGISSLADGGQRAWGSQAVDVIIDPLPLLAPFNTTWLLPHARGYMYGGLIGDSTEGQFLLRKNMDLHGLNGPPSAGIPLSGLPLDGQPGNAALIPSVIGTGPAKLAFIWRVATGPNGKPSVGVVGNEVATALLVVNVTVGDVGPQPVGISPFTNKTVVSPDGNPVAVTYETPTAFGGTPPITVACGPPSGNLFPIGQSTVTCTAVDSKNSSAFTTGTITVTQPAPPPTKHPISPTFNRYDSGVVELCDFDGKCFPLGSFGTVVQP
jgi:hypothetical protein